MCVCVCVCVVCVCTANHASTRRQARTDGGGEKEGSVPELCSLESVCGQACISRHIARYVFTTPFTTMLRRKFVFEVPDTVMYILDLHDIVSLDLHVCMALLHWHSHVTKITQ